MRRLLYRSPCWRRALYHGLWRLPSRLSYVDGRGRVLLSFDDGPSENSLRIGEELARRGQRALFFLRADRLAAPGRTATSSQRRCAEICGALLRRGHLPGNHGLDHLRLALRSPATVREQIAEAAERLGIAWFATVGLTRLLAPGWDVTWRALPDDGVVPFVAMFLSTGVLYVAALFALRVVDRADVQMLLSALPERGRND